MPKTPRTFSVKTPRVKGDDVKAWQREIKSLFDKMSIRCPIKIDGIYGPSTRSYSASLVHANGMSVKTYMKDGVTPELRTKLRNQDLTAAEKRIKASDARVEYRQRLREQFAQPPIRNIHVITRVILQDSWDFHPPVHDGIDVITPAEAVLFAPVRCKVIDVRASGWWNKGAPADPKKRAKGDGIIQLEVVENVGPFKKGMHIGYGHAEKAMVRLEQVVPAGTPVGRAGLANAWHIHLMLNAGNTNKGIGTLNPRACLEYTKKYG